MRARDNPLRADRVATVRFRLDAIEPGLTWEALLARLESLGWRGAIIGPEGSGKTTLLEDLAPHLSAKGWRVLWLRLSREKPRFAPGFLEAFYGTLTLHDFILFDGAEQLPGLAWRRFLRDSQHAAGLVVTTHRSGLLPPLAHCRTNPQLLGEILGEMLDDDAARWQGEVENLWVRHHGDLRQALRELYDAYAEM